ncbi:MAG: TonB-dependent receptor [Alphaproteobacteria bacterium]|nr:TonB-dependent receptor [Alphaproteobacteria bacterium]
MSGVQGTRARRGVILCAASAVALTAATEAYAAADEIIVTARKREESLQDIPISGVVLGKDFIDDFALDGTRDFIKFVPGAFVATNGGPEFRDDIVIRGSGAEAVESTASATSINRNGLFVGNGTFFGRTFTRFDLFDIERFEVFRGPQAALFGRNAVGGAVNVVSNRPKFEHEGSVKLRYEVELQSKSIELVENFPLNDKVAVRLGALYDKRDGGIIKGDDPLSPLDGENLDAATYKGVRIQFRVQPNDDLDINLTAEFSEDESPSFANILYKPAYGIVPGRDAGVGKFGRARFTRDDFQTDTETANIFLEADWDTSYGTWNTAFHFQNRNANAHDDFDAFRAVTPVHPAMFNAEANADREDQFQKLSGEIYLQSNDSTPENMRWLLGADFQMYEDHFEQFAPFFLSTTSDILAYDITTGAAISPPAAAYAFPAILTIGASAGTYAGFRGDRLDFYRDLTRRSKSYSGFGLFEYDVDEHLTASGEVRVIHNHLEGKFLTLAVTQGTAFGAGNIAVGMLSIPVVAPGCVTALSCTGVSPTAVSIPTTNTGRMEPEADETKVTPVATVKYKFDGGDIVYGRFATGFRPQDFEPRTDVPTEYDAETIYSYEIGYKGSTTLFGGPLQFDIAAFFNDHKDFQQTLTTTNDFGTNVISKLENVGDAWSAGVELGARGRWQFWGGRFTSQANFSYSNGRIDGGSDPFTEPLSIFTATLLAGGDGPRTFESSHGKRMPGTRDYQIALSGRFEAPVPNMDFSWYTNLAFTAQGGGYQDPLNRFELANYEDVTGSLGLRGEGWRAQLFARNIFNEIYELQRFDSRGNEGMNLALFVAYSQPRTWGGEVTINW